MRFAAFGGVARYNSYYAYDRYVDYYYELVYYGSYDKGYLRSVRCVQD